MKEMEKNNEGQKMAVDEQLLHEFFAQSRRMTISDNGFSSRLSSRLAREMPERQRMVCNAWSVVCAVVCVALFFLKDGMEMLRSSVQMTFSDLSSSFASVFSLVDFSALLPSAMPIYAVPVLVVLTLIALGMVVLYDLAEN